MFPLQADELPDLPTQSVTEEQYKDESGHIVVKKVTLNKEKVVIVQQYFCLHCCSDNIGF